jgi:hypothetical protein
MIAALHMELGFRATAAPASYRPPTGAPSPCLVKRVGGGVALAIGQVAAMAERTAFHALRAQLPAPVAGAVLATTSGLFTIDAVQPVLNDADGLLWSLDCSWGLPVVYRSVLDPGPDQAPPRGSAFVVAADVDAGAAALAIRGTLAAGRLLAGDTITLPGHADAYTVGVTVAAGADGWPAVPVWPALAGPVAAGTPVAFGFGRDVTLRAAPAAYGPAELAGSVLVGDRRFVLQAAALASGGVTPKPGDRILDGGADRLVVSVTAHRAGGTVVAWEIQAR